MFPVSEPELSFADISEYWAAELNISPDRIQALLEGAWWLGEISDNSGITPLKFLRQLHKRMRNSDAPTLLFITQENSPPAETLELSDGSLLVDPRPRVFVPSANTDTWSEASCMGALRAMAQTPSLKHYPECSPGFAARKITRDEFFRWIAVRGFKYPTFWKRTNDQATSRQLKQASEAMIEDEVRRVYEIADKEGKKPPNINEVAELAQACLREIGHTASGRQIKGIAERPEFKARRRRPGKTLSSEKRGPRK